VDGMGSISSWDTKVESSYQPYLNHPFIQLHQQRLQEQHQNYASKYSSYTSNIQNMIRSNSLNDIKFPTALAFSSLEKDRLASQHPSYYNVSRESFASTSLFRSRSKRYLSNRSSSVYLGSVYLGSVSTGQAQLLAITGINAFCMLNQPVTSDILASNIINIRRVTMAFGHDDDCGRVHASQTTKDRVTTGQPNLLSQRYERPSINLHLHLLRPPPFLPPAQHDCPRTVSLRRCAAFGSLRKDIARRNLPT